MQREAVSTPGLRRGTKLPCKDLEDCICSPVEAGVIISFFEFGDNHPFYDPSGHGIGQEFFHPVPGVDGDAAVIPGQEDQDAVVFFFLPYSPSVSPLGSQVLNILSFRGGDNCNDDLGRGAVRSRLFFCAASSNPM